MRGKRKRSGRGVKNLGGGGGQCFCRAVLRVTHFSGFEQKDYSAEKEYGAEHDRRCCNEIVR